MIKYLGSKRALLPLVTEVVQSVPNAKSVLDLFSGTSRVGHALKRLGYRVIANDHNAYAHMLGQCYVAADREDIASEAKKLISEFNRLPGEDGYFTETFCRKSKFFRPKNGRRVDAIRDTIETKCLAPELKAVVLVSLMEAADRVDSTCGLQMAYLKNWAPRAHKDIELRLPDCLPRARNGKCSAYQLDAQLAADRFSADVAYVDPPYNQHSYLGNYHIWETLVRWDRPEHYGKACKRIDCQVRKSPFNSKRRFRDALEEVVLTIDAKYLVVSFSDEGYMDRPALEDLLRRRGDVDVIEQRYKRYVGAQIGIHDLKGNKVGSVSHLENTERIYLVDTTVRRSSRRRGGVRAREHYDSDALFCISGG
ncbi:MAG: DNA adenine methylase [Nannocystaceae bacterium]